MKKNTTSYKKCVVFAFLVVFVFRIFAQAASVNADDSFYDDAMRWEQMGLTERLPNLRPYPLHLIHSILEQVLESENERAVAEAESHYERIFSRPIHIFVAAEGTEKLVSSSETTASNSYFALDVGAEGSIQITDMISYAYDAEITARKNNRLLPFGGNLPGDSIFDPAQLGPLTGYTDINMGLGFGKDDVYVTGGLSRSGYGPFWNGGLALNDSAYHQANIAFAFMRPKWNYVHQISVIGATNMRGDLWSLSFGKFMAFHALEINLFKKISFSYYESMIWGHRFDFTYLLPIMFMTGQHINGANDNLQMGLLFEYTPLTWLKWATDLFVDDFSINDLVKFNFDARYRFGLRTGLVFTPEDFMIDKITFDYTMQTPFLGAHWDGDNTYGTINYQNGTNSGQLTGSPLPPNSDRLALGTSIKPIRDLKISVNLNYIRHANVCESYSDSEAWAYLSNPKNDGVKTDGSIYSSQIYNNVSGGGQFADSALNKWRFLTQENKMHIFQTGLQAEYRLSLPIKLSVYLNAGYMLEYIKNVGVDTDIWKYGGYAAGDYSEAEIAQIISSARNEWKAKFYDTINNYFSFYVKVEY